MRLIHRTASRYCYPWILRFTVASLLLVAAALLESCCACTTKRCSDEVVSVILTDTNGTNFEVCESLAIRWSTDHANGEATESEIENNRTMFQIPSAADFERGDIIEVGTKKLNIELYCNDVVVLAEESALEWNEHVCNKCTDRPWCDDEKVSTGSLSIEIDPSEFPVNQN